MPGAPTGTIVGAVGYAAGLVPEDPYVFSRINTELHLTYFADGKWNWLPLGQPDAGVSVVRGIGVVVGQGIRYDRERPIAFVVGSDANLWSNTFDGTKGTWTNHGSPTGVGVQWSAGVVAVRDRPSQTPRPYVFVVGDDSTLWANWWNGGQWSWDPHGTPTNRSLSSGARVGATVTQPVAEGPEYPQVFVLAAGTGVGQELWRRSWNGGGWSWLGHGRPTATSVTKGLGAINYNGAALQTNRLSAFVAVNNLIYELALNGSQAQWVPHGGIPDTGAETAGAITVRDSYADPAVPYLFVINLNGGPVNVNTAGTAGWQWSTIPGTDPNSLGNFNTGTAVSAVRDTATSTQVPYVFYWSTSNTLQVAWLQ
nr:hypothetical protein [Micromonospora sp. DSM 115978]